MHRFKWTFGLSLVFALSLLLAFSVVGCSSKDRECGTRPDPTPTGLAQVKLHFNLTTLPQNCQHYYISCLQLNELQKSYEATRDTTGAEEQVVPLEEVPTTTDTIQIIYRESEDGDPVASSLIEDVELESDETKDFYQDEDFEVTPVEPTGEEITVNLTNCYADLSGVEQIKAEVTVNDEKVTLEGVNYSAEGTYALAVPVQSAAEYKVSSVVLYDDKDIPFEWLDFYDPVAAVDSQVALDVNENKFAGGSGQEKDPYLVANPRQLDNVRNDLFACYRQIKDIDFAGSCGGTLEPGGTSTIVAFQSNGDDNARFKGDAETKAYGWKPIGGDKFFNGTYDGGGCTIAGLVTDYQGHTDEEGELDGVYIGLFGYTNGAIFRNIALQDCHIIGYAYVGGISANPDTVTCDKCKVEANIYGMKYVGGLFGMIGQTFTITECTFKGQVILNAEAALAGGESVQSAGGIVGAVCGDGTISNCTVEGGIGSNNANCKISAVGGIVGFFPSYGGSTINVALSKNTNYAEIHGYADLGGIVGQAYDVSLTLDECLNSGSITSQIPADADVKCYVGGVLGYVKDLPTFANGTTSTGTITVADTATYIGGIIGYSYNGTVEQVKAAMADGKVAQPSGMVTSSEELLRGLYCGYRYVNSL